MLKHLFTNVSIPKVSNVYRNLFVSFSLATFPMTVQQSQ